MSVQPFFHIRGRFLKFCLIHKISNVKFLRMHIKMLACVWPVCNISNPCSFPASLHWYQRSGRSSATLLLDLCWSYNIKLRFKNIYDFKQMEAGNRSQSDCFGTSHRKEKALFTANILICESRKSTGVTNNVYNGSILLSVPVRHVSEWACIIPEPWNELT